MLLIRSKRLQSRGLLETEGFYINESQSIRRNSFDELINSIGFSGLHPTIRGPARPDPEGPS